MEKEEIELIVRVSDLYENSGYGTLIDLLIKLDESSDIRGINDLHSEILGEVTEISLAKIKYTIESRCSRERATFVEAGVRAQGGT